MTSEFAGARNHFIELNSKEYNALYYIAIKSHQLKYLSKEMLLDTYGYVLVRDHQIICTDFGGGWVGLRKLHVWILVCKIIRTPRNPIIIVRSMNFLGRECSYLGMGGWVGRNQCQCHPLLDKRNT